MSTAARIDELRSKFDENPRRYFAPLANEYRKAGELAQAIALCREHLPKQPGHMSGHIVFGQALYESGELLEAQEIFEAALTLDPENLIALRHLGDIARARGDASLARRWYERVLDADPRNDDISALLSSLSQRLTPRTVTPQGSTATVDPYTGAQEYGERAQGTAEPDDPFSAPDAPVWHTPAFLTPLAVDTVGPPAAPSPAEPVAESQLLDLDFPGESPEEVDATSFEMTDAESAHESLVEPFDERAASDVEAGAVFGEPPTAHASPVADIESFGASVPESGDAADPLAVALDAFATNDPFETEALADTISGESASSTFSEDRAAYFVDDAEIENESNDADPAADIAHAAADVSAEASPSAAADASADVSPSAFVDERDDFEEGLVAIDWPDASLINARAITPAFSASPIDADEIDEVRVAPISSEALDDAFGADVGSSEAGSFEAGSFDAEVVAESPDEFLTEANEPLVAAFSSEPPLDEDAFEGNALIEVFAGEPVRDAAAPDAAAPEDAAPEDAAPEDLWMDDAALVEAMIDEDPPLSVAEVPWLAVEEAEREAVDEVAFSIEAAEAECDAVEEAATATPAFVTETMAELFVAQGFLDRAVGVYEELVRRRPYDAVLSSRLDELRQTIAAEAEPALTESAGEPASTPEAWSAPTPLYGVTPVTGNAPLLGATPAWSVTPVRSGTPIVNAALTPASLPLASLTPAFLTPASLPLGSLTPASLTPASLPLVAPAPQRTARQFFAALASVRVARRTPSFGTVAVASPTPADGLASLFGEVPMPRDDVAARSLAQAFGSGEQIEPGPSLFTPAEPDEEGNVGASAPEASATALDASPAPAFSFDRFFPDPATAGSRGTAASAGEGAPSGASVVGSDSGSVSPASPSSTAGADLAQFAHWLKGLSNS